MLVAMMDVRVVRMGVDHRRVNVPMRMRLTPIPREIVRMPVMLVVHVGMRVLLPLVGMRVLVPLRDMQPHAGRHQGACGDELPVERIALHRDGDHRAEEWRDREIRRRARRPEIAQRQHE